MAQRTSLKIASLNINGFGALRPESSDNKWGTMYRTIKQNSIGVLLLQETHLTAERCADIKRMFKGRLKVLFSPHPDAPTRKEGVAVVLNKAQVNAEGAEVRVIVPGRALQVSVVTRGGEPLHSLCIYAPTSDGIEERRAFFREVKNYYESHPATPRPHLMAGDFNNVEDRLDRLPISDPDASLEELDALKDYLGLMIADGWRMTNPTKRAYTFHRGAGDLALCSRLDRIYCTRELFPHCREWQIVTPAVKTDHSMVTVQVTMMNAPTVGKGRPTFPLHLLKDKPLSKKLKAAGLRALQDLDELTRTNARSLSHNPQTVLSKLKTTWLELARAQEKATVPKMLAEIEEHEKEKARVQNDLSLAERERAASLNRLTQKITTLRVKRTHHMQANSRAKHHLDGERPTKYWSRLHKPIAPRDLIPAFEIENAAGRANAVGHTYESDSTRMAEMARAYHDNIQRDERDVPDPPVREECIVEALDSLDARLNDEQVAEMDALITYEECEFALKHSKSGTAPGLDGLPYELWKTLHARFLEDKRHDGRPVMDVIKLLWAALADVQRFGVVPGNPFSAGWMAPIYKEKGERTVMANYRPITLLNTDYKLLSKVLAIRLASRASSPAENCTITRNWHA
ncbi:Endonuclease/exonuclease/phosphatase [Lenzites betulinus]|nr:Endonuclease/exonuclease/phosphatase [Lenzites betulinus]